VDGVTHNGGASGVAGFNTDPKGWGVYGSGGGWGFWTPNNVHQDRPAGGGSRPWCSTAVSTVAS
jgi:hypothetical protein